MIASKNHSCFIRTNHTSITKKTKGSSNRHPHYFVHSHKIAPLIYLFANFELVKKITGIVFLSVLLLQVAGSYVYFIVRLSGIRHEMREQLKHIPDEELTLLTLTREEFQKAKADDHEVKVNGKMYDIARIVVNDKNVFVYALHDEAEDNLLALLNEMVKRSSKDKKPVPSQLIQLITLVFVPVESQLLQNSSVAFIHHTPYRETSVSFYTVIESPPPRG
jgi:hypothetical protein